MSVVVGVGRFSDDDVVVDCCYVGGVGDFVRVFWDNVY